VFTLGLALKTIIRDSSLLLVVLPVVGDLSKVCKNFLALEEENRQLSTQLEDVRRK
jgi:hypothetical protein